MNADYHFLKQNKHQIHELNHFLKNEKIKLSIRDEFTFFKAKMVKYSIELKNKLDSIYFFESEELKRTNFPLPFSQKNQIYKESFHQVIKNYDIISVDSYPIIFPIFSMKMNELYLNSPANFELPRNYHLIENYHEEIHFDWFYKPIMSSKLFDGMVFEDYYYFNEHKIIKNQGIQLYYNGNDIELVIESLISNNPTKLIELLLNSCISDKKRKKLEKLRSKKYAIK